VTLPADRRLAAATGALLGAREIMEHHESLIHHLMDTVRCSVCSATYAFDNVTVLGHQDELWFLTVTCPDCRTQGLIAALVRGEDSAASPPAAPIPANASVSDAPPSGLPIGDADVADMREFLRTFRGDFAAVVSQR
jgi:ribosomal protein S27E